MNDRTIIRPEEYRTQNLLAAEAHDAMKRAKSTIWTGTLMFPPADVVPSVEGTVLDPPPAVCNELATIRIMDTVLQISNII